MKLSLRGLTAQRKLVLRLLYVQQLEIPVVADMLNLSPQTIRNTKAQSINFLRKKLYDRDLLLGPAVEYLLQYMEGEL